MNFFGSFFSARDGGIVIFWAWSGRNFGVAVIVNWTATKQNIHLIASSFAGKDEMDICDGTVLRVKRALGP